MGFDQSELQMDNDPTRRSRSAWVSFFLETLQTVVMAVALYFLIDSVIARVRVDNISMEPTLMPGEFIVVNKLAYRLGEFNYGDIVVFHHSAEEDYIKRVIGLPGDRVEVGDRQVLVNEHPLNEPYIMEAPLYTGVWDVPEGFVFVLGDNRNQSSDSHSWGFVPIDAVVGKALVIYWPFDKLQVLTQPLIVNAANNSP